MTQIKDQSNSTQTKKGRDLVSTVETTCCIVGGGPAGAILALLLARKGIQVTLLEAHHDLDRDFRGDTIRQSWKYSMTWD